MIKKSRLEPGKLQILETWKHLEEVKQNYNANRFIDVAIASQHYPDATKVCNGTSFRTFVVALGAGSVLSSQEVTRTIALISRKCLFSFSRRVDWFDGSMPKIKLDIQLGSILRFFLYYAII